MRLGDSGKTALLFPTILSAFIYLFGTSNVEAQNGQALFETNCASCHHPDNTVTGPPLRNVREKWADGASTEDLIYVWVNDFEKAASMDPYAEQLVNLKPTNMNKFNLSREEIDAIFDYVDDYEEPAADGAAGGDVAITEEEEEGISVWWYIIGGVLLVVIFSAASIRRQLAIAQHKGDEEGPDKDQTYDDMLKAWAIKNQGAAGVIGLVCLFALLVVSYGWMKGVGVYENYHPSQPIPAFSHNIHAGINQIDCQYCHNSASKSKHAGIPTVNVCMNCHKYVEGASSEGKQSVKKIHAAAGFDKETGTYSGDEDPIIWNRVYTLPDHVYFNHSQHVNVGGLECQNCHGEVENMKTVYLAPVDELRPVNDDPENKLTKPTLTMGWCIECHNNTGVTVTGNGDYYEEIHRRLKKRPDVMKKHLDDEKITVRELGGWECSKCHY